MSVAPMFTASPLRSIALPDRSIRGFDGRGIISQGDIGGTRRRQRRIERSGGLAPRPRPAPFDARSARLAPAGGRARQEAEATCADRPPGNGESCWGALA